MRVITNTDGKPMCYHCARPFDKHPLQQRREELHAKLCAIRDDDHAARAFHHHRKMQAYADRMTELFVHSQGIHIPEIGSIHIEGIRLNLEPGVPADRVMPEIDKMWPIIRQSIADTLDGTTGKAEKNLIVHPYDPIWCPSKPTAEELYPFGYVRHADGSVEAKSS